MTRLRPRRNYIIKPQQPNACATVKASPPLLRLAARQKDAEAAMASALLQQLTNEGYTYQKLYEELQLRELSLKCGVIVQLSGVRVHVSGVPAADVKIVQEIAALCGGEVIS